MPTLQVAATAFCVTISLMLILFLFYYNKLKSILQKQMFKSIKEAENSLEEYKAVLKEPPVTEGNILSMLLILLNELTNKGTGIERKFSAEYLGGTLCLGLNIGKYNNLIVMLNLDGRYSLNMDKESYNFFITNPTIRRMLFDIYLEHKGYLPYLEEQLAKYEKQVQQDMENLILIKNTMLVKKAEFAKKETSKMETV